MKNPYKNKFEVIARAVVENRDKILLCRSKGRGYYFLPGGHLEFGEKIDKALAREMKEELGIKVEKISFIGIVDNIYTEGGEKHHEINLIFKTKVNKFSTLSRENHIDFTFLKKKDLMKEKIYPVAVKKQLIKWLSKKEIFWDSQFDK